MKSLPAKISILILLCLLYSCSSPVKDSKKVFEGQCWSIHDSLQFELADPGMTRKYQLAFDAEFLQAYKYRNLYVGVCITSPSGLENRFVLPLELMDDAGNWFGKSHGEYTHHHALLTQAEAFQEQGSYRFSLWQYMQDTSLCGVQSAAFSIFVLN